MSTPATAEEIVLSSNQPVIKQKKIFLRNVTSELLQKNQMDGVKKLFRIYDNRVLSITEKSKKSRKTYVVALSLLDEKPQRKNTIDILYVCVAIGLAVLAFILHSLKNSDIVFFNSLNSNYIKLTLVILAVGSVFCFFRMMKNSVVIKTANGQLPIVELYEDLPSKTECQKFLVELVDKISRMKKSILMPSEQKFAAEISEHRRLRDEGVITEEQYETAKTNIFNNQALRNQNQSLKQRAV